MSRARASSVRASQTRAANEGAFSLEDWALFCGISLLWGASFLLIAESLEAFTPGVVTLGRVGLGAMTLTVLRLVLEPDRRISRDDRRPVVVLAVVWVAIPFTLFPIAQQWINSAVTGLLNGATPIFVAMFSVILFRVAPRRIQVIGLVAGFVGVMLISLGSAAEGSSQLRGVLITLAATLLYGIALNLAPPLQAKYGAVVLMSHVLAIASVFVAPLALVNVGDNDWQARPAIALAVLGAFGTGIAYWIMVSLVGRVGSIRASFITYLIPVVSLVLGVVFRSDNVSALALVGAPITIVGAVLASRGTD